MCFKGKKSMQNLILNSLNSLKSLETHFKPFQGVQATFKVVLRFADVNSELSPVKRIDGPVSTDKSEYNYK
jgi:hypothetical protein